jgi:hypothetical protein
VMDTTMRPNCIYSFVVFQKLSVEETRPFLQTSVKY